MSAHKKRRGLGDAKGEDEIEALKAKVKALEDQVATSKSYEGYVYASDLASLNPLALLEIPVHGHNPDHVKAMLVGIQQLDNNPHLNTSSYVNVSFEEEELDVAALGATINIADSAVYPASTKLHDKVVDLLANLWHCPTPPIDPSTGQPGHYSGSGTAGSTEACLLAGLAHKFRWRKWYGKRHNMSDEAVLGVRPNLVMSSCFQACWEKFFRYFDVEARFVKPSIHSFKVVPEDMMALCDDKTLAVVAILGNHYAGTYDPVWEIDAAIDKLNKSKGYQIGIHVDAASGGFVAPFQSGLPPFDFRLDNVLSISTSGHKFGESICGTGWVVFRHRNDLTEHIAVSVAYLGGHCDSITLNFSRPAAGVYVQAYKFMRLGQEGYRSKVALQMKVAAYIRSELHKMKRPDGKPRFEFLDDGDTGCLPVVAARLTRDAALTYDDIDLQHALAESHWYVCGYGMSFENLAHGGAHESLFRDADTSTTMFRIVCKSNITMSLAVNLVQEIASALLTLDEHGFSTVRSVKEKKTMASSKEKIHKAC